MVVAQPDPAPTVGADDAAAAVEQSALTGTQGLERLAGSPGHAAAVEVVDAVVAHPPGSGIVVETAVVLGGIHQAHHRAHQSEEIVLVEVILPAQGGGILEEGFQPLRGVEEGGLVHIVPEALDAEVGEHLILFAKPRPGLGTEKVGEVGPAGPDRRHKGRAVFFGAEIALLEALAADGVIVVAADACVDDGDEPDALGFQVGGKFAEVGEAGLVDGKISVGLHVINVHADHVQRQTVGLVLRGHLPDVGLGLVAKAALSQTERPLGRDIAGADEMPKSLCDLCRCRGCDEVERIVRLCRGKAEGVVTGIADVVAHFAREIDEDADASAAVGRGDEQEIVGGVVGKPVFAVLTLVGVVRLVVPAALVEAPGHLAQAIDDVLLLHDILPAIAVRCQVRHGAGLGGQVQHDALGGKRLPDDKTLYHKQSAPLR